MRWLGWSRLTVLAHEQSFEFERKRQAKKSEIVIVSFGHGSRRSEVGGGGRRNKLRRMKEEGRSGRRKNEIGESKPEAVADSHDADSVAPFFEPQRGMMWVLCPERVFLPRQLLHRNGERAEVLPESRVRSADHGRS